MNKKFNLNGVEVELSKEKLQDMLEEYDKPKWEINNTSSEEICLYKNGSFEVRLLAGYFEDEDFNLTDISRTMAEAMGDLMETEDVLNGNIDGHSIFYNAHTKSWQSTYTGVFTNEKHFKTTATAELAAKILNDSKCVKEWIKEMKRDK